jgi:drug/metabolite transporter (DMT)-like permease
MSSACAAIQAPTDARMRRVDLTGPGPLAAYAAVCFVWGSTFLAIRVAVQTLPPWSMISVRSLVAGSILTALALARGAALPGRSAALSACVSGLLMFAGSQAMLAWGEIRLPSGLAAVLSCTVSLFTPVVAWALGVGQRPSWLASLGLLAGFAGVAVLVRPDGVGWDGTAAVTVLVASLAWAFGAGIARRVPPATSALLGSGLQLLAGGIGAAFFAGLRGEWLHFQPSQVTLPSLIAMLYLIVMGSLVAFACFGWLVQIWRPETLSTYAYINPLVALTLGAVLAGEAIGAREVGATVLILGAVGLVMLANRRPAAAVTAPVR